jgi:hypothetical protein
VRESDPLSFEGIKEEPMRSRGLSAVAGLLLTCAIASPVAAGVVPYLRLDYGASQLRMSEGNKLINDSEAMFKAAGYPADFQEVGPGRGPGAAVGLWVFPAFRVGATYSYLRSVRNNRLHVPGQVFYAEDLDFRMTEIGAEAAVRIVPLAGFTVGANIAQGRAQMIEGYSYEDASGQLYEDATARSTKTTYGAFVGIDQTNPAGLAGYIRVGFQYRNVGSMPSQVTMSDGTNTVQTTGTTIPLDYSGYYVRVGIGYDLVTGGDGSAE